MDVWDTCEVKGLKEKNIFCWLLYKTDEEKGISRTIHDTKQYPTAPVVIKNVLPGSLCYLLFQPGKFFIKESLPDIPKAIYMGEVLFEAGERIGIPEEILTKIKGAGLTRRNTKDFISEIIVDDSNGFCVLHPIVIWRTRFSGSTREYEYRRTRKVNVYYAQNKKRLIFLIRNFLIGKEKRLQILNLHFHQQEVIWHRNSQKISIILIS